MNELREQLAALEHDQWAAWTRWQIDNASPEMNQRWERQIATPYAELTEREKDSDREWADKVLAVIAGDPELRRLEVTYWQERAGQKWHWEAGAARALIDRLVLMGLLHGPEEVGGGE